MDAYEWNNNSGSFTVTVTIERDQEDTSMFVVDSSINFANWACLPNRARCTPDRAVADEKMPGEFHVIVPASSEWSISVPDAKGTARIHAATGTVCLSPGECTDLKAWGRQQARASWRRTSRLARSFQRSSTDEFTFQSITEGDRRFAITKDTSSST